MPANISAGQRAAMGADSGLVRKADGTSYDWQAALETLLGLMGGSGVGSDMDAIRIATELSAILLASIDGDTSAIQTAVEIIDNFIGTIGSAHTTGVGVLGLKAESTVPTEVADGEAVAVWGDTFGRLIQLATDIAQNAMSVSDISPATMQVARWLDWAALTTPADETPEANVQDYKNFTIEYIIASIGVSVDLKFWGSVDGGTTWFLLTPTLQVLAADDQTNAVSFTNMAVERIKCEFDAEDGGTPTVTFKAMAGN